MVAAGQGSGKGRHISLGHGIAPHLLRNSLCHSADSSKTLGKVPLQQVASLPEKNPLSTSSVVLRVSWAGLGAAKGKLQLASHQECFVGALG